MTWEAVIGGAVGGLIGVALYRMAQHLRAIFSFRCTNPVCSNEGYRIPYLRETCPACGCRP